MSQLFNMPFLPALTLAGSPASGAKLYFYVSGSSTPATVYSNATLSTAHANPVVADVSGRFPPIYLDDAVRYHAQLTTSAGVQLGDVDPIPSLRADLNDVGGAGLVRFRPNGASGAGRLLADILSDDLNVMDFGAKGDGITDDTAAIQAAIDFAPSGGAVRFPSKPFLVTGSLTLRDVTLSAEGITEDIYPYGQKGARILLTGIADSPFKVAESVTFEGLTFFYPNQIDQPNAPIWYPPMITHMSTTTTVAGFTMRNCVVVNAFDFFKAGGLGQYDLMGRCTFSGNRIFALRYTFDITNMPDYLILEGNHFGWSVYADELNHVNGGGHGAASFYLRKFASDWSTLFRIWGDGTATARSSKAVEGIIGGGNFGFGFHRMVDIDGGALSNYDLRIVADATQQIWVNRNNGFQIACNLEIGAGSYAYNYESPLSGTNPFIYIDNPAPSGGQFNSLAVSGVLAFANGSVIRAVGAEIRNIDLSGLKVYAFGKGVTQGDYYACFVDAPNARVMVSNCKFEAAASSLNNVNRMGIVIAKASILTVSGNQLILCNGPVQITASTATGVVTGNVTVATTSAKSYTSSSSGVAQSGNNWDRP